MPDVTYEELRYNLVRQRASHNSFLRDEDIADQLVFWRLRSIELDLQPFRGYVLRPAGGETLHDDWFVFHEDVIGGRSTTVEKLSDALLLLAGFHDAVPLHEVVTVALDLKAGFTDGYHTPALLDGLIEQYLPGLAYTPATFAGTRDNLQGTGLTWPRLSELRGKFIFICTGGSLDNNRSFLNQYLGGNARARTCFVCPSISNENRLTDAKYADAVFFNLTVDKSRTLGTKVFDAGYVSRAYTANSQDSFNKARNGKIHLIATDKVNSDVDTWSHTHNSLGWPFDPIGETVSPKPAEAGTLLGLSVSSDDIYGSEDSFLFVEYAEASKTAGSYTYAVAVPSSSTPNKNGKAGLMARASADANAANFAVLRVADENEPRAQVRAKAGESTSQYKLDTEPAQGKGISRDSWIFLKLELSNEGKTVKGSTSYDGVEWVTLHEQTFDEAFTRIGLVGNSHTTDKFIRYYFIPVAGFPGTATATPVGDDVRSTFPLTSVYPAAQ